VRYEPLEFTVPPGLEWVLAVPAHSSTDTRENPESASASKRKRRSRKPEVILPPPEFKSLRVQVALIRDEDFDPTAAPVVGSAPDVAGLFEDFVHTLVQESLWVLILNAKHAVIGIYEVARGSTATVEVAPADIIRPVLVSGNTRFIIAHNHPSGDPAPSLQDREVTTRVVQAAQKLGMQCLDHIVFGYHKYVSLNETNPGIFLGQ
jgi:DNA repair protein RadC